MTALPSFAAPQRRPGQGFRTPRPLHAPSISLASQRQRRERTLGKGGRSPALRGAAREARRRKGTPGSRRIAPAEAPGSPPLGCSPVPEHETGEPTPLLGAPSPKRGSFPGRPALGSGRRGALAAAAAPLLVEELLEQRRGHDAAAAAAAAPARALRGAARSSARSPGRRGHRGGGAALRPAWRERGAGRCRRDRCWGRGPTTEPPARADSCLLREEPAPHGAAAAIGPAAARPERT